MGNSYRLLLPAGTAITLPDDATAAQVRAVTVNEVAPPSALNSQLSTRQVRLTSPLQLVSPAYIAGRNATELRLLELLALEQSDNARLRAAK